MIELASNAKHCKYTKLNNHSNGFAVETLTPWSSDVNSLVNKIGAKHNALLVSNHYFRLNCIAVVSTNTLIILLQPRSEKLLDKNMPETTVSAKLLSYNTLKYQGAFKTSDNLI